MQQELLDLEIFQKKYYQNANGILLLYDVTNEESFNDISDFWIKEIKKNAGNLIYLVGNKIDNPKRVISYSKGKNLAISLGIKYFEICCKYNINITEVMSNMILEYLLQSNQIINDKIGIKKALNLNLLQIKNGLDKYINF